MYKYIKRGRERERDLELNCCRVASVRRVVSGAARARAVSGVCGCAQMPRRRVYIYVYFYVYIYIYIYIYIYREREREREREISRV